MICERLRKTSVSVDNPEALDLYAPRPGTKTGEYEYLIITKNTYVDDFQPLADFYTRRGIRTEVHAATGQAEQTACTRLGHGPRPGRRASTPGTQRACEGQGDRAAGCADGPGPGPGAAREPY